MPILRVFLAWKDAALPGAVDYLISRYGSPGTLDLEKVIIATPGGRVSRRLLELLVEKTEEQHLALYPPRIVTAGMLPELLYHAQKPFANDFIQQLVWIKAMQGVKAEILEQFTPAPPEPEDLLGWLALGNLLKNLHRELAADTLDFGLVAKRGSLVEGFCEQSRWEALAEIQRQYLSTLDGLDLWDLQTARLFALDHQEFHSDSNILLLGTVDLNRTQRQMLDQVADRVTTLIFAPQELADRFDKHGCLCPDDWLRERIDLRTEQIQVVDDPSDQAEAVVNALAALEGRFSADEITIGVLDEPLVPFIEQHLQQCTISCRYGVGMPIARSAPYRLLVVVAEYLETASFSAFAALVRHPSVQDWLLEHDLDGDWLTQLDRCYADHLPASIKNWNLGDSHDAGLVKPVIAKMEALLQGFRGKARTLMEWGNPILGLLVEIFGRAPLDPGLPEQRSILASCEKIRDVLQEQMQIGSSLVPTVEVSTAIQLLLQQIDSETIAPPADRHAIELLGWLELPLDDAPVLIVTGFNEGKVPSSLNADLFLPNKLRRVLGIEDNDRRFARDAYALSLLAASRAKLKIIAGRRSAEGDPLVPSRLLFACDDETLAKRVLAFFSATESQSGKVVSTGSLKPGQAASNFQVPKPRPLATPIKSMRVTEFRDYLACPYRYYLKHVLRLEALGDHAVELDGAAFGSLAHLVLGDFGTSPVAASTDQEEIEQWLSGALEQRMHEIYGSKPLPAILVQVEQLRFRLLAFARWQAEWARQGWRIEYTEVTPEKGKAAFLVDDKPMLLRGRIDRIDYQPATGKRVIFDYKTSDSAKTPDQVHRQMETWVDLQLPLYRHLVKGLGIDGPLELAYILLPKDTERTGASIAEWTPEDLRAADQAAADVIRKVWAEEFEIAPVPPPYSEEFSAICQDHRFGKPVLVEESNGGIIV